MRWGSAPVIGQFNSAAAGQIGAPIYVEDWWGCAVDFLPQSAGEGSVTLQWGELAPDRVSLLNQPPTVSIGLHAAPLAPIHHVIPHLGPYLLASVFLVPVGTPHFNLALRNTNRQERPAETTDDALLVITGQSVPVGLTKFPIPGYVGPAFAYATTTAGINVNIELHGHIAGGPDELLDQFYKGADNSYRAPGEIFLPPLINEVWVQNAAGAAQNVTFALTPCYR